MNLENLLFFIMTTLPFSFCFLPSFHFYTHQKRVYSVCRFTVSRVRLICKSSFLERYSITENAKNAGLSYDCQENPNNLISILVGMIPCVFLEIICPGRCSSNVCCIFSITRQFQILSHDQNPADNLLVCRIPLVLLLQIPMEHCSRFCACRKSDRIDLIIACAANNSCFICPCQCLARIAAHAGRVREAVQ